MCMLCNQTPCPSRCPNSSSMDDNPICDLCGREIGCGEYMFRILDHVICDDCVLDGKEMA